MGYILPVRPLQSEQYANRIQGEQPNYAKIKRVEPVQLKSDFLREYESRLAAMEEQKRQWVDHSKMGPSKSHSLHGKYAVPNPINLAPEISKIVQKGNAINAYV